MSDPRDPVAELCGEDAALLAQTARDLAIEIGKESDDGIAALKEEAARLQSELNQMVGEWPRVVTKLEADVQRAMGREERWKKEARSATERAEKAMEDLRTARLAEEAALEKVRQAEEAARTAAVNEAERAAEADALRRQIESPADAPSPHVHRGRLLSMSGSLLEILLEPLFRCALRGEEVLDEDFEDVYLHEEWLFLKDIPELPEGVDVVEFDPPLTMSHAETFAENPMVEAVVIGSGSAASSILVHGSRAFYATVQAAHEGAQGSNSQVWTFPACPLHEAMELVRKDLGCARAEGLRVEEWLRNRRNLQLEDKRRNGGNLWVFDIDDTGQPKWTENMQQVLAALRQARFLANRGTRRSGYGIKGDGIFIQGSLP